MVIKENHLITENQNTPDTHSLINNTLQDSLNSIDTLNQNEKIVDNKGDYNNQIITNCNTSTDTITASEENADNISASSEKETVETNCLALTVRKDYNFAIAKNTIFKTIRMSIKVAISTLVLNFIKLFL